MNCSVALLLLVTSQAWLLLTREKRSKPMIGWLWMADSTVPESTLMLLVAIQSLGGKKNPNYKPEVLVSIALASYCCRQSP